MIQPDVLGGRLWHADQPAHNDITIGRPAASGGSGPSRVEDERDLRSATAASGETLELAREHGRLTIRGAVAALGANRNTVKSHLRQLVGARQLTQHGPGRGTWYEPGS